MGQPEGRRLNREVNLRHVVMSRREIDIGKVNTRPCEYFAFVRLGMFRLNEPQYALQDQLWVSLKVIADPRRDRNRSFGDF